MIDSFTRPDPTLIDVPLHAPHDGYPLDQELQDTPDALREACGAASREFPKSLWIEPRDWAAKAKENDALKTWPVNYVDRYTNQSPTHECTCHSLRALCEAARNRQRGIIFPDGPRKDYRYEESARGSVWLSPLSIYAEANPRQWGGAGIRQVMEIACRRGMLPETVQPSDYGLKHALNGTTGKGGKNQSSGPWTPVRNFPAGWEQTAAWFKPLEVIFPDSWEQAVCLVLNGIGVGVGYSGHAYPWMQAMFSGADFSDMAYPDSYDVTRYNSLGTVKRAWSGSFGIATMTAPDDWLQPAGGVL
jgi:hypothetical protein